MVSLGYSELILTSASPIHKEDTNLVITEPADGLAAGSAGASSGTVLVAESDVSVKISLAVSDFILNDFWTRQHYAKQQTIEITWDSQDILSW